MLRSGIIVAFYTLLSRILGLVRELFIADLFGSTSMADSVNVALKLPNLFRRIFGEGALSSVFVPIFNEKLVDSKNKAENFASNVFWWLLIVLTVITISIEYFMPNLMYIIAPGFYLDGEKFEITVLLCRISSPYLIFICLSAFLGGILNSVGRFAAFAFVPIILNIAIVFITIYLGHYIDLGMAISYSVIIGGLLQLLFMFFCLIRAKLYIKMPYEFRQKDSDITKLLRLFVPATISSGAAQINIFISQSIASFIPGAVSILSYAERLYQFPLSIIGIAFGTVLLPKLSKLYKIGERKEIDITQNNAIKFGLFLSVPCSIGIMILSHPIIYLIYQHGAFNSNDTINTANALSAFAIGLPAFILAKIFTPIFYANLDTKTPMNITIVSLVINTMLNVILINILGTVGVALGSSIAAWINLWLLIRSTKRRGFLSISKDSKIFFYKMVISSFILAVVVYALYYFFYNLYYSASIMISIFILSIIIFIGVASYIITSFITGIIHRDMLKFKNIK